ncbi:unnamed protein product [Microthlaspi erraticum]|uniref:Uncharacterized protein n=1 Tax=Microthlaspi erraticum TaxID=1685480 RepID=A0A6D2K394_9BRAS|nr:unnamed protein product [Microthlaspi erraticum]
MPPFRFRIPFFSNSSPSRISSGTSSPPPPPPPPTPPPSRPPFRPAGIAQPSKPVATSPETKSKLPPTLSRAKSNVAAMASASSASSARGAAMPTRLPNVTNQSGSPLKKPEPLRTEEAKVIMKEKPLRETEKEGGENINRVIKEPPIARSTPKEAEEAQEQRKKTEMEKRAVEERNLKTAQELQKGKETKKLAVEERDFKTAQELQKGKETEKLAVEEKKKLLRQDMEENSKSAPEQQKKKETEKLASQETNRPLHNATQSNTTRHISAASEATRGPRELPERKMQSRTDIHNHTNDNHQKTKGKSTSDHGNLRFTNGEGSSSMSRKIKEDIRDGISKLTWGKSEGDEKSVSVFTLTGENRGATMAINSEKDQKDGEVHIRRGYRSNPEESPNTTETEGERRRLDNKEEEEDKERVRAYVNGNTQAINNSIVCDSSVQENDPGIHMSVNFEELKKKDETISPPKTVAEKKPEPVKVKNEPRVRRRCLRGLLAESSESGPENPLKPRRHGCRFTCKDKDVQNT